MALGEFVCRASEVPQEVCAFVHLFHLFFMTTVTAREPVQVFLIGMIPCTSECVLIDNIIIVEKSLKSLHGIGCAY